MLVAAEDPGIAEAARAFSQLGVSVEKCQVDLAKSESISRTNAGCLMAGPTFHRPTGGIQS